MGTDRNIHYLEGWRQEKKPRLMKKTHKEAVITCKNLLLQTLQPLVHELFVQADDDLYRYADASNSNKEQNIFFDAMRSLRLFREQAESQFLRQVGDAFDLFAKGEKILPGLPDVDDDASEDNLSLVDKDELEEQLAVNTMASKTFSLFATDIQQLDQRFAHLAGVKKMKPVQIPSNPAVLAEIFHRVLSEWEAEMLARIILYKGFEQQVLFELGEVYSQINQFLEKAGILPELIVKKPAASASAKKTRESSAEDGVEDKPKPKETAAQGPTIEELWQLVQSQVALSVSDQWGALADKNLPTMPRETVMSALSNIQADALEGLDLEKIDWSELQNHIRKQLGKTLSDGENGPSHRFGDSEQHTLDVILTLFNHILDDPNLPDAMRANIARLQIPILKAAIDDPTFVANHEHPARLLLDTLAVACVGWNDDGDRSEKSLYAHVKHVVDRIVHEYHDDISLFETVREDFLEYLEKRERKKKILEKRLAQSVTGEDKMEIARAKVDLAMENLNISALPLILQETLNGPWKQLMVLLILREGDEGENYVKTVNIAKMLIKIANTRVTRDNRTKVTGHILSIIGGLQRGLNFISYDQGETNELLGKVKACLLDMVSDPEKATRLREEAKKHQQAQQSQQDQSQAKEQIVVKNDRFSQLVDRLPEETWIKLRQKNAETLACKLVWRSKYTRTMVFVDGQGNKVAQLKEDELAEYFRKGNAQLMEDVQGSLIDRAIKKMVKVLNARIVGPRLEVG